MTRPLRFLQATTFFPPYSFGGDAVFVARLAHALAERGHQVDVVHCLDAYRLLAPHPDRREGDAAAMAAGRTHPNITVHGLSSGWRWLSPLLSQQTGQPYLKRRTLGHLLSQDVDVIHFHNASLFGPGVLSLGGAQRAVKLYTTHEHWLVCPTHVLWRFNKEPCQRPTCFRCTLAAGRPPQLWRYTRLLAESSRHVDRFLSPSRFTAQMHAERGFAQPVMHFPPFSVRCDDDWRDPGPRPHGRPYFLYVGRLEPIKGVTSLLEAWRTRPDIDLVVIGDGSERAQVEAAAAQNPRIMFKGKVASDDLGPYYVHALGVVVPSVGYEVSPTVVLEAFARKTPVVARNLGGTAELVRDGEGGVLYETPAELQAALSRLASDVGLREELGARGYRAFVRQWTEEAHISRYLTLIDEVAASKFDRVPWRS